MASCRVPILTQMALTRPTALSKTRPESLLHGYPFHPLPRHQTRDNLLDPSHLPEIVKVKNSASVKQPLMKCHNLATYAVSSVNSLSMLLVSVRVQPSFTRVNRASKSTTLPAALVSVTRSTMTTCGNMFRFTLRCLGSAVISAKRGITKNVYKTRFGMSWSAMSRSIFATNAPGATLKS